MTIGLTYHEMWALKPCRNRSRAATRMLGGRVGWDGHKVTAQQAKDAGVRFDDVVWAASALAATDEDVARRLRLWLADCAAHVLNVYEKQAPDDPRVRGAIIAARQSARGEIDDAAWDAARAAAWDAARAAAWDAARAAAWDAAWDAARAAARDAAGDAAWAAARDAARAAAWAAAWDAARAAAWDAAWDAEEEWQYERLVAWLSDPEPDDWPLPDVPAGASADAAPHATEARP